MATDCRISAQVDFIVYSGETWDVEIEITDANGDIVDVSTFTAGPLVMYDKRSDNVLMTVSEGVNTSNGKLKILYDLPMLKKNMTSGNYFECPLISPSGQKAIVHGITKVDGK